MAPDIYKVETTTEGSSRSEIGLIQESESVRTEPFFIKRLYPDDPFQGERWNNAISLFLGRVTLYEVLNTVNVVSEHGDQIVDNYSLDDHSRTNTSHAFWIDLSGFRELSDEGLGAFEQLLRIGSIFTIPADLHDTTTHSEDKQVYLIENYPGGIGIVKKAYEQMHRILQTGMDMASACNCPRGCPNCIIPPRYYRNRDALDKNQGIKLANLVIATTNGSPEENLVNGLWEKT